MRLLREVTEGEPVTPHGGWNVGHLANLGMMLSCDGFSIRLDVDNLNKLFDFAEDDAFGEIRDHTGQIVGVSPTAKGIVLLPSENEDFPNGLIVDLDTLKEMGIEQYEEQEQEPESEFDELSDEDIIDSSSKFDPLEEGVKRAYRRVGKKIKRGFRVTSGFRKGRIVSSAAGAFKPRAKASTRTKLKLAARKKRIIRVLKGKMTRRKSSSKRLATMNKRLK